MLCLRSLKNVSFFFRVARYFGLAIGMEVFWPLKDLSLDDAKIILKKIYGRKLFIYILGHSLSIVLYFRP